MRYDGYPSKVAKLLPRMYPSTAAADRYARGTIIPNPERNGPPLRSRGGLEKIISNFRRVASLE